MPNWCNNSLTIAGPEVGAVLAAIRSADAADKDARILDFDRIAPYPQGIEYDPEGYKWSLEHWGTRENANEPELELEGDRTAHIRFYTAWSPPVEVFDRLARTFPEHTFTLEYEEGGIGFAGRAFWAEGDRIYNDC